MSETFGKVFLVGAGPGDPGLLTLRGKEALERADVVLYDSLANDAILQLAPQAEHIDVGKRPDRHTLLQDEINTVLLEQARRVDRIVRLKGGDPFVFGRGGEECLFLAEQGVPFEVVPGVTAGMAAPAYAGIPVTHRGKSTAYTLISAHDMTPFTDAASLPELLAEGTLAFYMAMTNLPELATELIRLGKSNETPVAVVQWGSRPKQRTVTGTLSTIAGVCDREGIEAPAIVLIGDVVELNEKLSWFEHRPLFGKRIVVTRSQQQAGRMVRELREFGADVFEFPTIAIEPTLPDEPIDDLKRYDWIVFTSVNGVEMLFERMEEQGLDGRDLAGVKLCVIGTATADAVAKRFLRCDCMPEKYVAEHLLEALREHEPDLVGKRFLLPRADIARSFLPKALRDAGAEVTELVTYRTVKPGGSEDLADALLAYKPDLVTFTSSSTSRNFCEMIGPDRIAKLKETARFAAIGPITAATAEEHGLPVTIEPAEHDVPHFIEAIVDNL